MLHRSNREGNQISILASSVTTNLIKLIAFLHGPNQ